MIVEKEILSLSPDKRAAHKAKRLAETLPSMSRPFQRNNIRWTIKEWGEVKGMLRIVATARTVPGNGPVLRNGEPVEDHEFFFINPPIMVPDGAPVNGVQMFKEDLAEAVRLMLASQV